MRCIHSHRNCFSNLSSPTKACQQRYGDVSKVFWKFTTPYRGMPGGISISTEIVSEIYPDLLTHVGKAMGMHLQCFGHLSFPTEACQEVYPYPPNYFGNLPWPTMACRQRYVHAVDVTRHTINYSLYNLKVPSKNHSLWWTGSIDYTCQFGHQSILGNMVSTCLTYLPHTVVFLQEAMLERILIDQMTLLIDYHRNIHVPP